MAIRFNDIKKELDKLKILENESPAPVIVTGKNFPAGFEKRIAYNTQIVALLHYFRKGEIDMIDTVKFNLLKALDLDTQTSIFNWPLDYKEDAEEDLKNLSEYLGIELNLEEMLDTKKIKPQESGSLYLFLVIPQQNYFR